MRERWHTNIEVPDIIILLLPITAEEDVQPAAHGHCCVVGAVLWLRVSLHSWAIEVHRANVHEVHVVLADALLPTATKNHERATHSGE